MKSGKIIYIVLAIYIILLVVSFFIGKAQGRAINGTKTIKAAKDE